MTKSILHIVECNIVVRNYVVMNMSFIKHRNKDANIQMAEFKAFQCLCSPLCCPWNNHPQSFGCGNAKLAPQSHHHTWDNVTVTFQLVQQRLGLGKGQRKGEYCVLK